jgi:hypothetical protein
MVINLPNNRKMQQSKQHQQNVADVQRSADAKSTTIRLLPKALRAKKTKIDSQSKWIS